MMGGKECFVLVKDYYQTWSSPRCHLRSHSLIYIKNHLSFIGIGKILNKELKYIIDLIALIVHTFIARYHYYTIDYIQKRNTRWIFLIYKNVTQCALFFEYKNAPPTPLLISKVP